LNIRKKEISGDIKQPTNVGGGGERRKVLGGLIERRKGGGHKGNERTKERVLSPGLLAKEKKRK